MNKQEYMNELNKALKKMSVADIDDILEEYEQHFICKLADGHSEEEITAKLGSAQTIAEQFAESSKSPKAAPKAMLHFSFFFLDVIFAMAFLLLYSCVIALGALSIVSAALSVNLALGLKMVAYIPPMPPSGGILFGLAFVGLALLSGIGTIYSHLYICQWAKAYLKWHKNILNNNGYPNLPLYPTIKSKNKRIFRMIIIISLLLLSVTFIVGFIVMALYSGEIEFWHKLGWFI